MLVVALWQVPLNASPDNVILIYADDLGYGDLSCYGATGYETPELDRMAKEGMRFSDFSTSSSICTPSRAGLLTGRYAKRWGHDGKVYFPESKEGMPPSEVTIAELLRDVGYRTALVGKWHLGHRPEYLPTSQGFELYYGIPYSNDMWQSPEIPLADEVVFHEGLGREQYSDQKNTWKKYRDKVPLMLGDEVVEWPVDQRTITRKYTEKAQEFIRENAENPFFLYLAHAMPHVPLFASDDFEGISDRGLFGDVVEELDWSVGEVLGTLRELGLEKKTLVLFTSDNGPWLSKGKEAGSSGPLRDGKFTDYEGGCRVPCIAWQPGAVPEGAECHVQASTLDVFPTVAAMAGAELPKDRVIDGRDIRAVLAGSSDESGPEFFLYRSDHAIRVGEWKLVKGKRKTELFNLAEDVGETKNLAQKYPERIEALAKKLLEVNEEMKQSAESVGK
ncbi:MAG: sulfatase family protein [Verrucomicrobiales bacterium]